MKYVMYFVLLVTASTRNADTRAPKQLFTRLDKIDFSSNYKFCKFNDATLPCLHPAECQQEGGTFLSYCGSSESQCCNVIKHCRQETHSHAFKFRNARYPKNETTQEVCTLKQHIRNGICAVRMNFESFQTTKPHKDFCPGDSLLVLGTGTKVARMCGNLTSYSTTFDVQESSQIDYVLTLQGYPAYKFSLEVVAIPCNAVTKLTSSPLAGLRNKTAVRYEKPVSKLSSATENPTSETTATPNEENMTMLPDAEETSTYIYNPEENEDASKVQALQQKLGSESLVIDDMNRSPPNSYFKEIFDKMNEKNQCESYDNPYGEGSYPHQDPLIAGKFEDSRCWAYDSVAGTYIYIKECDETTIEEPQLDEPSFRIIDGSFANLNEYPWQVAILYNRSFVCGGALISDRYILTAAHCVNGGFKSGLEYLRVTLGDHDLSTSNETKNVVRHVKKVIPHIHYFPISIANDIALLELKDPVEFSYSIIPVKLPTDLENMYENATVTITGWGRYTRTSRKTSKVLKEFTSEVSNVTQCVEKWKEIPRIEAFEDMHICLNISKGTPCHGDSGGPLVACNGDHCTVVGVVSFAFPLCRDVGLPAVFTRVTTFKPWIDMNTTPIHVFEEDD